MTRVWIIIIIIISSPSIKWHLSKWTFLRILCIFQVSRICFPLAFLLFIIGYWTTYLSIMDWWISSWWMFDDTFTIISILNLSFSRSRYLRGSLHSIADSPNAFPQQPTTSNNNSRTLIKDDIGVSLWASIYYSNIYMWCSSGPIINL